MKRSMTVLLVVLLFIPFLFSNTSALPSQDTSGKLGLAIAGEGSGAYYFGVVNMTIDSSFTIINIGSIAANCTIESLQSEGPLDALEISLDFYNCILYPQESVRVPFTVRFVLNASDLCSVDWSVYGEGEEHTAEGTNILSVGVTARSYFQILGRAGVLTVEVRDQRNDDFDGLNVRIRRDYLTYATKSTREGQSTFLLSVPANYSISIIRGAAEVYHHKFEMTGDMRLKVLVERPLISTPPDYTMFLLFLIGGIAIGWVAKWTSDIAHKRYRSKKAKIKLGPEEKVLWDWATRGLD